MMIVILRYTAIHSSNTLKRSKTQVYLSVKWVYREVYACESNIWIKKKLGLTQTRLGEEIGVSQQTISKYENVDENISGDMLLALSKFFKVPVDYILRKDEEEQQREQDNKREIMELYRDMDQYNRDTWIIIGKRLLGGQLHKYNEDSIVEKG